MGAGRWAALQVQPRQPPSIERAAQRGLGGRWVGYGVHCRRAGLQGLVWAKKALGGLQAGRTGLVHPDCGCLERVEA